MVKRAYQNYILTKLELEILLNRSGCKSLYGFFDGPEETTDEKEVYRSVVSLFSKGLLVEKDGKAKIEKKMHGILKNMSSATLIVSLMQQIPISRRYICYINEDSVVITSCSETRESTVNLTQLSEGEFREFLKELLPEEKEAAVWSVEQLSYADVEEELQGIQNGLFSRNVVLTCELRGRDNNTIAYLSIMEYMLNPYILYGKTEKIEVMAYSAEAFLILLKAQ